MLKSNSFLLFFCFILLFNCKKDIALTFEDQNISTETNTIVEVNIPKAIGSEAISEVINSEIERVVISHLQVGDPDKITSKSIEESITAFHTDFENFKSDFPEAAQLWEAQIDGEVMYQSPDVISVALTSYQNTGGAHGLLNISFLNFDASSGKVIPNTSLIRDLPAFKKVAQPHFDQAIKEKHVFDDTNDFVLPENIAYTDDGLVLLYNTYEIAPYSTGIIEFAIPYSDIKAYLVFDSAR